jgi:hypothetical protein
MAGGEMKPFNLKSKYIFTAFGVICFLVLTFQNCSSNHDSQDMTSVSSPSPDQTDSAITCPVTTVTNGTVGAAPACQVTCDSGYSQNNGTCVVYDGGSCAMVTVANGTVGAAPGCSITCDSSYTQQNGSCIIIPPSTPPSSPTQTSASFSCTNSGTANSYNVVVNVTVASTDLNKEGTYFFIANYQNNYYTYDGAKWNMCNESCTNATGFPMASLVNVSNYSMFTNSDFTALSGTQFYIGYGLGNSVAALNEMLANNRLSKCGLPL